MVDNIGNHCEDQVAGRGRAKALECYADGNGNDMTAAKAGDNTAHSTQRHEHAADHPLAEFVGQRHDKHGGHSHRDRAHDAEQALRGTPGVSIAEEGVVQHPLAVVAHRAVLHRAAPLEQHVECHDDPPHTVAGHSLELLTQRGSLLRGGILAAALLGNTLTGEKELQINRDRAENGHCQHGNEPEVLILLQCEGNEHREYHRTAAHDAQTCNVREGGQRAALLAVTGRNRDHRRVGGVVDGIGHGVVKVISNRDPDHLGRALKGNNEHQHACDRKRQRREQDPRAGLAGQCAGTLNQLAYHEVGRYDQDGRNQLQRGQKTEIQLEDICEIILQDACENTGGKQCAERADKIAEQHFRHFYIIACNTGPRQRGRPEIGFGCSHKKGVTPSLSDKLWSWFAQRLPRTSCVPLPRVSSPAPGSKTLQAVPIGTVTRAVIAPSASCHAA